jgi:GTP cyclohydrolase I
MSHAVTEEVPAFTHLDSGATAASERIRRRLRKAGVRFHANDNVAPFILDGELAELRGEVEGHFRNLLKSLVIDIDGDHNTADTAKRVAKMYVDELFYGRFTGKPRVADFPNVEGVNELLMVGPITVRSACSHHFCPIMGRVWIGVLPNEQSRLIGLSKYARICDWIMSRPQIQEEAVALLANELQHVMNPNGLAIVMKADHFCMHWRGVKDAEASMTSSIVRGAFLENPTLRQEFFSLLPKY